MGTVLSILMPHTANSILVGGPTSTAITMSRNGGGRPVEVAEAGGDHAYRVSLAEQQRLNQKKKTKMLSKLFGTLMVILSLLSILVGPEFNGQNTDRRLFDMSIHSLDILYRVILGLWLACFILYTSFGAWSKLKGYQRRVHRLLFIALIIAAVAAQLIVPNQIQLSYAPAALTILAEVTYLLIDLTCDALDLVFRQWIPSLSAKLYDLMLILWNKFGEWVAFRMDIHVGRRG